MPTGEGPKAPGSRDLPKAAPASGSGEAEAKGAPGGLDPSAPGSSESSESSGPFAALDERAPGWNEFAVFLSDLEATPVSAEESALAIRDATIAELRLNLAQLRPLGDRLAETEKQRLALADELEGIQSEVERLRALEAELRGLPEELEGERRVREKLEARVARLTEKYHKRDRLATERWHKLRTLRREQKALIAELKEERRSPVDLKSSSASAPPSNVSLVKLFDPAPSPENTGLASPAESSVEAEVHEVTKGWDVEVGHD